MRNSNFVDSTPCAQRIVYLNNNVQQGNPNKNAKRCCAKTRSTGLPCKGMAMRNKVRCRLHGGKSTGAKTQEGKANSRKGNWKHGFYSSENLQQQKLLRKMAAKFSSARLF